MAGLYAAWARGIHPDRRPADQDGARERTASPPPCRPVAPAGRRERPRAAGVLGTGRRLRGSDSPRRAAPAGPGAGPSGGAGQERRLTALANQKKPTIPATAVRSRKWSTL